MILRRCQSVSVKTFAVVYRQPVEIDFRPTNCNRIECVATSTTGANAIVSRRWSGVKRTKRRRMKTTFRFSTILVCRSVARLFARVSVFGSGLCSIFGGRWMLRRDETILSIVKTTEYIFSLRG